MTETSLNSYLRPAKLAFDADKRWRKSRISLEITTKCHIRQNDIASAAISSSTN